jgi:hypothetical protein
VQGVKTFVWLLVSGEAYIRGSLHIFFTKKNKEEKKLALARLLVSFLVSVTDTPPHAWTSKGRRQ